MTQPRTFAFFLAWQAPARVDVWHCLRSLVERISVSRSDEVLMMAIAVLAVLAGAVTRSVVEVPKMLVMFD